MVDALTYFHPRDERAFTKLAEDFRRVVREDERHPAAAWSNRAERAKLADCLIQMLTEVGFPLGQSIQLGDFLFYMVRTSNGLVDLGHCTIPALILKGA